MNASAQVKSNFSFKWEKVKLLPKTIDSANSLGFAGMIGGFSNDIIVVAGGANFPNKMPWEGGIKKYYDHLYLYKKEKEQFRLLDFQSKLPDPLAYAACYSYNNQIFVIGGENENGLSNKAFFIQINNRKAEFFNLPDLPFKVSNAMITIKEDLIYVLGGDSGNKTLNQFIYLDLVNKEKGWQKFNNLPYSVSNAIVSIQKIKNVEYLYLLGGRAKNINGLSTFYKEVIRYDFQSKTWEKVCSLPYPLAAGTGFKFSNNEIILVGGDQGKIFNQVENMINIINSDTTNVVKEQLNKEKALIQSTHPGFINKVILYNSLNNKFEISELVADTIPVTTSGLILEGIFYIFSGEIKPGIRSPYIYSFTIIKNNE